VRPAYIYTPGYVADWAGHIFPIQKYRLIHQRLIQEGVVRREEFIEPAAARTDELLLVHTPEYLTQLDEMTHHPEAGYLMAEIAVTREVLDSFILSAGGTIRAVREGIQRGAAANVGGGFHHAFANWGEGFCLINDIAVGIRVAQRDGSIHRAAVIDCDLHQGNGTAKIFQHDKNVYTFSIHQQNNYPVKQKSDWDIGLDDYTGDQEYLDALSYAVPKILDTHAPELVVYVAGADPYKDDQLGLLKLTKQGLARRDELVLTGCKKRGIIPIVVLAGGYPTNIQDVVDIHFNTLKLLSQIYT
jgi:acetoin utilization deacetylase AcuC-like enzyme